MGKLNTISIVNPQRLEIETQFLQADEMTPKHNKLAISLGRKGITVYNNTPLLPLINLSEDEIGRLAYGCRSSGIEFHHLYIAGHPVQVDWCETHPIELSIIIDIATALRRKESGRGIPRFIISTPLGDVDFGLCSEATSDQEGRIYIKLKPYCREYYQSMDPSFAYPADSKVGKDGHPIIMVPGLEHTRDFMLDKQKDKT
ncbi:hypothetical protein GF407_09545 [candidate division KSB1 bacterium]|nr:hypothetical protein [candidate division KSB1 bacterium]